MRDSDVPRGALIEWLISCNTQFFLEIHGLGDKQSCKINSEGVTTDVEIPFQMTPLL